MFSRVPQQNIPSKTLCMASMATALVGLLPRSIVRRVKMRTPRHSLRHGTSPVQRNPHGLRKSMQCGLERPNACLRVVPQPGQHTDTAVRPCALLFRYVLAIRSVRSGEDMPCPRKEYSQAALEASLPSWRPDLQDSIRTNEKRGRLQLL